MKTTNTTAGETAKKTTNNLIYRASKFYTEKGQKYQINVELRLSDECGNGHEDFGFTCDGYRIAQNGHKIDSYGGCAHEKIKKHFPGLIDDIEQLHNCDYKGAPMYPAANGFYFIQNHDREAVKNYLYVCSAEEIDEAMTMNNKDQLYFAAWLEEKQIPRRWQKAAAYAIEKLESLTGMKFESTATKSHYTPLSEEEKTTLKERLDNGYYTEEAAAKREEEKINTAIAKSVEYYTKKIEEAQNELKTRIEVFTILKQISNNDLNTFTRLSDNFIIYTHNNTICFNWADHRKKVSDEEIKEFEALAMGNDILNQYEITSK